MGELKRRAYVAGGKDARIAGLQTIVDAHAGFAVVLDARLLETDSLYVGRASRGHQYLVHFDLAPLAAVLEAHDSGGRAACDVCDFASGEQLAPIAANRMLEDPARVAILARQDLRQRLQQPYLGAEEPKRLRELASDRPRADHREPPRQLGQREDGLVGEKSRFGEPRNRRRARPRAGCDQRTAEV